MLENFPRLCGQSDLVRRWVYTREGLRQLMRRDSAFPQPVAAVNGGRTQLWLESDIADYERSRPWLWDQPSKKRRQVHFFIRSIGGPA